MAKIKSIKRIKRDTEQFLNIAVENDESYIANGIVVHNCRSILRYITQADVAIDEITPDKDLTGTQRDKIQEESGGFVKF